MNIIDANAIIERVKQLRRQHCGERGRSEFARALGLSSSTYAYYERNRVPPVSVLVKICDVTGADLVWLLTGSAGQGKSGFGPYSGLLERLEGLLMKNPELADAVCSFVDLLCQKRGLEQQLSSSISRDKADRTGLVPILGRTAAGVVHFWEEQLLAGGEDGVTGLEELVRRHVGRRVLDSKGSKITVDLQVRPVLERLKHPAGTVIQVSGEGGEEVVEFVECPELRQLFPDSFGVRVDGDSMSPRINDGNIVIASASVPAAEGQAAIVRVKGQIGVTCKLIRTAGEKVHLIPINERYETKVVGKKDLLWALAVLCHVSV